MKKGILVGCAFAVVVLVTAAAYPAAEDILDVSGKTRLVNRDPAIAVDGFGNGLVVWNQSNARKTAFGKIYAAEIIRGGDGTYRSLEPFLVNGEGQRPTVSYLPDTGVYSIIWDTGPRSVEDDTARLPTSIEGRLYTPSAKSFGTRAGDLDSVITLVDDAAFNVSPTASYVGPFALLFEQVFFHWYSETDDGRYGSQAQRKKTKKSEHKQKHVNKKTGETFQTSAQDNEAVTEELEKLTKKTSFSFDSTLLCPEQKRAYYGTICRGVIDGVETSLYGIFCFNTEDGSGTFTEVGKFPDSELRGRPYASLARADTACSTLHMTTNAGVLTYQPAKDKTKSIPTNLGGPDSLKDVAQRYFEAQGSSSRQANGTFFVYHRFRNGKFEVRPVKNNNKLGPSTKLWKIRKNRLGQMEIAGFGADALVVWSEFTNKKATKSRIRLGVATPK